MRSAISSKKVAKRKSEYLRDDSWVYGGRKERYQSVKPWPAAMPESVIWRAAKLAPLCYGLPYRWANSRRQVSGVEVAEGKKQYGRAAHSASSKWIVVELWASSMGPTVSIIHTHCRHTIPLEYKSQGQAAPEP